MTQTAGVAALNTPSSRAMPIGTKTTTANPNTNALNIHGRPTRPWRNTYRNAAPAALIPHAGVIGANRIP
jgi:hypothetical protein